MTRSKSSKLTHQELVTKRLPAIRHTFDNAEIDLLIETRDLHSNSPDGLMLTHVHSIGERSFTCQPESVDKSPVSTFLDKKCRSVNVMAVVSLSSHPMKIPNLLILAGGSTQGDNPYLGSVLSDIASRPHRARISLLVSDGFRSCVSEAAHTFGIRTHHLRLSDTDLCMVYRRLVDFEHIDFTLLLNWNLPLRGLDPRRTFSISSLLEVQQQGYPSESTLLYFATEPEGQECHGIGAMVLRQSTASANGEASVLINWILNGNIHWDGIAGHEPMFPTLYKPGK